MSHPDPEPEKAITKYMLVLVHVSAVVCRGRPKYCKKTCVSNRWTPNLHHQQQGRGERSTIYCREERCVMKVYSPEHDKSSIQPRARGTK